MNTLSVEQAVFASSDHGRMKGYHLVAKSAGIDAAIGQELCRWAPTQFPIHDAERWTINYYPLGDDQVAVTRTVLGGPEYSGRGGTQVVTLILLLDKQAFSAYQCNAISVAKHALALGALCLPLTLAHDGLPTVELPSQPIIDPGMGPPGTADGNREDHEWLTHVLDLLNQSQRMAVVGLADPIQTLSQWVGRLTPQQRWQLSFTTGLAPTAVRPFQLHFLETVDAAQQRTLDAQNIVRIDAPVPQGSNPVELTEVSRSDTSGVGSHYDRPSQAAVAGHR